MFTLVPVLIVLVAVFAIGTAIYQKIKDDNSPVLTVSARLRRKWEDTTTTQTPIGGDISSASGCSTTTTTTYYVEFQVESGDTLKFNVDHSQYRHLNEGSLGDLTFQGSRYLSFVPPKPPESMDFDEGSEW